MEIENQGEQNLVNNVRCYGDTGPAALFLHSLFLDGTMFDRVTQRLPVKAYCPDFRGMGERKEESGGLSIDDHTNDMADLLRNQIREPVHLVGSSMGAYVGVRLADRLPHLISSITLLCCTAGPEKEPQRFSELCDRIAANPAGSTGSLEEVMFGKAFRSRSNSDPERRRWRSHFQSLHPRAAEVARHTFAREGMEGELRNICQPTLLIAGEQDQAKKPENMRKIRQLVPGSRLEVISQAGHTPAIETPSVLAEYLADWFGTGLRSKPIQS